MSSMRVLREKLAEALEALNADESWIQVSPYQLSNPRPPTVQIVPGEREYDVANARGGDTQYMTVQALVAANYDVGAQTMLDKMRDGSGALSVKALIEADTTLGGTVDDLRVVKCGEDQIYALSAPTIGCEWQVEILTSTEEE